MDYSKTVGSHILHVHNSDEYTGVVSSVAGTQQVNVLPYLTLAFGFAMFTCPTQVADETFCCLRQCVLLV